MLCYLLYTCSSISLSLLGSRRRTQLPVLEESRSSEPIKDGGMDPERGDGRGKHEEGGRWVRKTQRDLPHTLYANWGDAPTRCKHPEHSSQTMTSRWSWRCNAPSVADARREVVCEEINSPCAPCAGHAGLLLAPSTHSFCLSYLDRTRVLRQMFTNRASWIRSQQRNEQSCISYVYRKLELLQIQFTYSAIFTLYINLQQYYRVLHYLKLFDYTAFHLFADCSYCSCNQPTERERCWNWSIKYEEVLS